MELFPFEIKNKLAFVSPGHKAVSFVGLWARGSCKPKTTLTLTHCSKELLKDKSEPWTQSCESLCPNQELKWLFLYSRRYEDKRRLWWRSCLRWSQSLLKRKHSNSFRNRDGLCWRQIISWACVQQPKHKRNFGCGESLIIWNIRTNLAVSSWRLVEAFNKSRFMEKVCDCFVLRVYYVWLPYEENTIMYFEN